MKKFNLTMHHFRAIAILCIVIGHITLPPQGILKTDDGLLWVTLLYAFIGSSSSVFAFISGYLSYIIEYPKFVSLQFSPPPIKIYGYGRKGISKKRLEMFISLC